MSKLKVGDLSKKINLKEEVPNKEQTMCEPPLLKEDDEETASASNSDLAEAEAALEDNSTEENYAFTNALPDISEISNNEDAPTEPLKDELVLYTQKELEKTVKSIAGGFYGVYISKYHPGQLEKGGKGIRHSAALEVINFAKDLLQELKKEGI